MHCGFAGTLRCLRFPLNKKCEYDTTARACGTVPVHKLIKSGLNAGNGNMTACDADLVKVCYGARTLPSPIGFFVVLVRCRPIFLIICLPGDRKSALSIVTCPVPVHLPMMACVPVILMAATMYVGPLLELLLFSWTLMLKKRSVGAIGSHMH